MSFLEPGREEVQSSMAGLAATLAHRAAKLAEYADSLREMTDEQFEEHLGDQYGGPGFLRQMQEQVFDATNLRKSDISAFERAISEAFGRCQRQSAATDASHGTGA